MAKHSDITKRFLLAAKRQEIAALQQLSSNCRTVKAVKDLIHQLQRERGISNVFLGSKGELFVEQRQHQLLQSKECEQTLRSVLKSLYLGNHDHNQPMRLLSRITFALQGIDHLPVLREKVDNLALTPLESTSAYSRLIAGLLEVVFEAADVASDPQTTRLLVALFNFMQGKEYAGQERAWGAIGFAQANISASICDKVQALTASQSQCFDTFVSYADDEETSQWEGLQQSEVTQNIERLRRMICQISGTETVSSELSEVWYEVATQRIDTMQLTEEHLTGRLTHLAESKIVQAEEELRNHELLVASLNDAVMATGSPFTMLFDKSVKGLSGLDAEADDALEEPSVLSAHKSFYELIRDQSQYIHDMKAELAEAKQALHEQKSIDRAKLLLMQQGKLSEQQAYRKMQTSAMAQNIRLADLAKRIVTTAG
ncbi:nitrate regulatory protein [Alteromonas antoniana]|uniref:nitrate regulatory protein n=1 Tax=Alteromonas antoniana TaxID=2803813 RepID=UPI001C46F9AA|nr:nitrate regulatory protein [Alteromonas antoniana]